jgi:hypothetical protein
MVYIAYKDGTFEKNFQSFYDFLIENKIKVTKLVSILLEIQKYDGIFSFFYKKNDHAFTLLKENLIEKTINKDVN